MPYQLPNLFNLERYKNVYLDIETTGLQMYHGDRVVGISIGVETSDREAMFRYYPVGHEEGPNYDKRHIYKWLNDELRSKTIIGHNIGGFDVPFLRHDGCDLIGHNNFRDTMHGAILHNPSAPSYSLDACAGRYLGSEKKITGLDKERMAQYHPSVVGPYAEQDTRLCWMLDAVIGGHIHKRGLETVYDLECKTIRPVVEMQANGLFFDHKKAKAWIDLASKDLWAVEQQLGSLNYNSGKQLKPKCDSLGIEYPWNWRCATPECDEEFPAYIDKDKPYTCWKCSKTQQKPVMMLSVSPHFGKKFLKKIDHEFVRLVLKARQMHKLLNTFLKPWVENIDPTDPILRFTLNQLRERDEQGSTSGAVSGRFSCSSIGSGAQPQQIWATENQIEEIGEAYLLRRLFIPEEGKKFLSIDASQIEFRLFAHYSENTQLVDEYKQNPKVDFHSLVAEKVLKGLLPRKKAKNVNFGTLYNMGVNKFAREMNISTKEAEEMMAVYNQYFPAAIDLRNREKRKAQSGIPTTTLYGRRFDWDAVTKKKAYVALNRLIQGSAADLMKLALVKAYEGNYFDKMRLTVHDEIDGDITRDEQAQDLKRDLEDPAFCDNKLAVPLLWEEQIGPTWSKT